MQVPQKSIDLLEGPAKDDLEKDLSKFSKMSDD